jgi:FMN reductase
MSSLSVLVGNPLGDSRTRHVAERLGARISKIVGATQLPTIDLSDYTDEVFRWPSEVMDNITSQVREASIVIFASPTYKASYTGLLKAFLDRYPSDGLSGVTAVPLFTIGSPRHALAVEFTLRPLLVELGASVPTRGLSFETARFDECEAILGEWVDGHSAVLSRL